MLQRLQAASGVMGQCRLQQAGCCAGDQQASPLPLSFCPGPAALWQRTQGGQQGLQAGQTREHSFWPGDALQKRPATLPLAGCLTARSTYSLSSLQCSIWSWYILSCPDCKAGKLCSSELSSSGGS